MEQPLLEVQNLKTYFPVNRGFLHAVDDISFSIPRGRTLGVVGESGCGKSTLGRTILGLTPAVSGEIRLDGVPVLGKERQRQPDLQRKIQMIFQDPYGSLNPRMSVGEIIADPILVQQGRTGSSDLERQVLELMEKVGLSERLFGAYPHELDGGRRQRVGIARALALHPDLIVCDEPVSSLDVSIQAQILNLLMELQEKEGFTYLFITHDLSVVRHISHEIVVMYLGQCVEQGETEEIFSHPSHPYTRALLDAIPRPTTKGPKRRPVLQGEVVSPIDPKPGCRFAGRCSFSSPECEREDVLLREAAEGHWVRCRKLSGENL
ncbi:ATP-binding cassette domain-containing protein [Cuneatibacter sp. NSJ-177]|uniref:ABC transporter ATP-binding protein n=1 Tax=Cuneatibacter sp. NSJ-177 TaxID=2931401 RepID=UPI001FD0636F|nr:ATP-binding cassette domain-containing protein [Cuneatibacter sp. NSJ-177]